MGKGAAMSKEKRPTSNVIIQGLIIHILWGLSYLEDHPVFRLTPPTINTPMFRYAQSAENFDDRSHSACKHNTQLLRFTSSVYGPAPLP